MGFFFLRTRGFALVEIVVAVGIGLLASVVVSNLSESRRESRDTLRVTHLEQIQLALRLYRDSEETYPDTFDEGVVIGEGGAFDEILTPYLSGTIVDPLGDVSDATYEYVYDSDYDGCTNPGVGTNKKVLYAKTMERTSSGNWDSICGGTSPGTDTFGIILQ